MSKRIFALLMAAATLGGIMFSGCSLSNGSTRSDEKETKDTTSVSAASSDTDDITGTTGSFNHGHSISEASTDRPYEIKRSSDVLTNKDQALEYLENCVELPGQDFKFVLTDTSDNDPGAYMWYEFTVSYKDILIMNSEFTVVTFTDGTICEGRPELFTCTFADPADVIDKDEALKIYAENAKDNRDYKYLEDLYYFSGKGNIECKYVYKFKYDCGNLLKNNTILINAKTGEMVGCWPDAID